MTAPAPKKPDKATRANDQVFASAKRKIGKALRRIADDDVANIVSLCETLAKMKTAESRGKDDDWGSAL